MTVKKYLSTSKLLKKIAKEEALATLVSETISQLGVQDATYVTSATSQLAKQKAGRRLATSRQRKQTTKSQFWEPLEFLAAPPN